MEKIVLIFTQDKSTKNTYTYEPVVEAGKAPVLQRIYLPKWVAGSNPPTKIQVTIEEVS